MEDIQKSSERWVNLKDIAEHLSASQDAIREWIKKGKIPYCRAGRAYKFRLSEVDRWLMEGKISDNEQGKIR